MKKNGDKSHLKYDFNLKKYIYIYISHRVKIIVIYTVHNKSRLKVLRIYYLHSK